MTNQFDLTVPVAQQRSSDNTLFPKSTLKVIILALSLSLIPALGIGAGSYHLVSKSITEQISQTPSGGAAISPALQRELLWQLTLLGGGTALFAGAIATFLTYRLSLHSSELQYSQTALLFREIASPNQPVELDSLYKRAIEGAREILNTDRVMIYKFDANWTGTIVAESVTPGVIEYMGSQITDTCMKDSKGELYRNGRVSVINDVTKADLSECHLELLEKFQVKANLVVPIIQDDHLLGLLIAHQCDRPRVWQLHEINFFIQLASLIALRLSNLNIQEQKAKVEKLDLFSLVGLQIRQSLTLEEVFNTAAAEIQRVLNVDRVVICHLSPNSKEGTVIAESVNAGLPKMFGCQLAELGVTEQQVKEFNNGLTRPIDNLNPEAELVNFDLRWATQYDVKASLVAPIRIGNGLQGLIIAHQCSTTRTWEPFTLDLFEELAAQAGLAMEQAMLLKSVTAEAKRMQFLAEFTSGMSKSLNAHDIFSVSVEEIRKLLECDRVLVYRFNPDNQGGQIMAQAVAPNRAVIAAEKLTKLFRDENFQGYKTGSIWVTHDVHDQNLTPNRAKLLERLQIRASLVTPIIASDQLVGLLCAHQSSNRRDWQQSEFYFFKQLAVQMGFALDQANLIEQVKVVSQQQQQQTEELQRQLFSLIKDVEGVAKGDLTVGIEVNGGEIGTVADSFNRAIKKLREIVTQVKLTTTQVNASLGDNEGAIRELSLFALKQAEETTRTLNCIEHITRSIQQVANSAYHATEVARTASKTAQSGTEAMEHTVQKITSLRDTVAEAANKVRRLGQSSQEISKVVSLINQIALQTNLLAVNAGIEAARAGEEGQSFAVVAEEVAELAVRSADATQEIERIVQTIQQETNQVVEAMKQGTTQVSEGSQLVEDAKNSLSQILQVSRQIDQLVASISQATSSQVEASSTVGELMKEMATISERTSESSHQISESLQHTLEVARKLQASVEFFNTTKYT